MSDLFPYTVLVIPSVREVLSLPVLTAARPDVIGGGSGLVQPVRWVHISDAVDLTGLLQGGELVLTTGPAFAQDLPAIEAYLRMLSALRVVGLVVELGTHVRSLPKQVGSWADELGLPVVVLVERIRFVDVTEQVHRLIVADRYEEVQFARATHETFTSLNMSRASPRDIVTKASDILARPVVLEDLARHVLAFGPAGQPAAALLDGWAERSRRNSAPGDGGWLSVPVGAASEQWGRLLLPGSPADRTRSRMVLERAAQSLQLQRMIEQDREALLVQALGGLLDELLTGRVSDHAEAMSRAVALGMSVSAQYVPLVIMVEQRRGIDALARGAVDRQVLTAARQAVAAAGLTAIGSIRREGAIAMVMGCPYAAAVDGSLAAVCAGVEERLLGRVGDVAWAAGTAPPATDLITAVAELSEAGHVAEVGVRMSGRQRLFRSADVRLLGLLALLRSDHRVQGFAEAELGRLRQHDERTGDDLMRVLRAFLDVGGAKADAAQATGLSRPTLYARLRMIERILGVSLAPAESRTSLHAAFMIIDSRG